MTRLKTKEVLASGSRSLKVDCEGEETLLYTDASTHIVESWTL